jgi:alkylation response protein AidB-like acyl-CoA dehydrogenase
MATVAVTGTPAKGGSFLLETQHPEDIFSPADLTDDQKLIAQTAEEFVNKEVLPLVKELEEKKPGLLASLVKKAGELGLLCPEVPEAYGGTGLDKISTTRLLEKISVYGSFSGAIGAHSGIGTIPILYFGTEEQKKKYLPKLVTGEWIGAYALSEAQAGSDALNSLTRADLSPDGKYWILNGQKMWITNGGFADVYTVFAKVNGEKFSAFIVERGTPGFSVGAEEHKLGIHGSSTTPLFFENCKIPKENLLHEIGRGHVVAFNTLNSGRLTLGVACIGGAKNVLGISAKYATERKAFGKSIGEFGLIREKLAEMAIRTLAAESMAYRAAGVIEAAIAAGSSAADKTQHMMKVLEEYAIESSILKVYGSEVLDYVVDEGVQIFGGYGFHEDYPVSRAYRDSRINRIFEGTNEINRMLIIQMLMKRAVAGTLPLMAAGAKLQEEILSGSPVEDSADGQWAEESRIVRGAKKVFLLAAGAAIQKYRDRLADQQEIIGALADIVLEIYPMESALLRAEKAVAVRGKDSSGAIAAAARVLLQDGAAQVEASARMAIAASIEGDMLRTQLAVLRRMIKREPADTIALRRAVADAVVNANGYPFEGR